MNPSGQLRIEDVDLAWMGVAARAAAASLVELVREREAIELELDAKLARLRALRDEEQALRATLADAMDEAGVRSIPIGGARIVRVLARTRTEAGTVVVTGRDGVRVMLEERG